MKRLISILLCLSMLLPLIGCSEERETPKRPVNFYYRRADIRYGQSEGVITSEERESIGYEDDLRGLLLEYIGGPVSGDLARTFPEDTVIISFYYSDGTAKINFSHQFAQLTGIDLTIACACVTMTVIELTGIETVQISAAGALLDDYQYITMDKDCLLLLDTGAKSKS